MCTRSKRSSIIIIFGFLGLSLLQAVAVIDWPDTVYWPPVWESDVKLVVIHYYQRHTEGPLKLKVWLSLSHPIVDLSQILSIELCYYRYWLLFHLQVSVESSNICKYRNSQKLINILKVQII